MTERPFQILGVQQIAIGNTDKTKLRKLWCELFGLSIQSTYTSEKENVDEDILKIGKGKNAVELDLMVPFDTEKSPKVHIPPLNHIGLWVDKLEEAVDFLEKEGVRFTLGGIRKGASGHNVCFIHPKGNEASPIGGEGVLIELVQAPPERIAENS